MRNIAVAGFPWWSSGLKSALQCRDTCLIPHLGRSRMPWGNEARELQLLSACSLEPRLCNRDAAMVRSPHTTTRESSPCSSEDPAQPKINNILQQLSNWSLPACCSRGTPVPGESCGLLCVCGGSSLIPASSTSCGLFPVPGLPQLQAGSRQ